jgi:hypothetical protein
MMAGEYSTRMSTYGIIMDIRKYMSTLEVLDDSPLTQSKPIRLGVLGHSSDPHWDKKTIGETLLNPLVQELEKFPDEFLLGSGGNTSIYIQNWAETQGLLATVLEADWCKLGKRAGALRDGRILKEATHLLIFLGQRSNAYEKIAIREVKKGKKVYTVDPQTKDLTEWIMDPSD